jgi:hypothetical protein
MNDGGATLTRRAGISEFEQSYSVNRPGKTVRVTFDSSCVIVRPVLGLGTGRFFARYSPAGTGSACYANETAISRVL